MFDKSVDQSHSPKSKPSKWFAGGCLELAELDQIVANRGRIRRFCLENECETNETLQKNVDQLLQRAKLFHSIAPEFFLDELADNGE